MRIFSNIKWLLHVCIIAMVCAVIGACATGRSGESPVRRVEPNFDYNPAETTPGKTDITFAAVGSQFDIPFGQTAVPIFKRFADNMANDFGEIITARGYTLRGPFQTFDEMTFVDKDNSNLILTANVDLQSDFSSTTVWYGAGGPMGFGLKSYRVKGPVRLTGRISLIISESLTNEKMWTKSVNITPIVVEITPHGGYDKIHITLADVLQNDDRLYTSLGLKLDRQYQEIMNRTYGYLDPREMALLNKQAAELRKRKTF